MVGGGAAKHHVAVTVAVVCNDGIAQTEDLSVGGWAITELLTILHNNMSCRRAVFPKQEQLLHMQVSGGTLQETQAPGFFFHSSSIAAS